MGGKSTNNLGKHGLLAKFLSKETNLNFPETFRFFLLKHELSEIYHELVH